MRKQQSVQRKEQRIEQFRAYYRRSLRDVCAHAFVLNVSLASNPFLKDQQQYKMLKFNLQEYNRRVEADEVHDPYEMASYERLHSMVSDLAQMDTREDQVRCLHSLAAWFEEQSRLVEQRRDQGVVRYQITNELRNITHLLSRPPPPATLPQTTALEIPSQMIDRLMGPFDKHNRTAHPQLDMPARRLGEYKRKIINIAPFIESKEESKPQRVLYPMPPKHEEPKEEEEENKQDPPEGGVQIKEDANEGEPEVPMLGEEPEEPPEEEEAEGQDKDPLKPKDKNYTAAVGKDNDHFYKEGYLFFKGKETEPQRNLQLRYVRRQYDLLRRQKEDLDAINVAHEWAKRKAKMGKELQKKLEQMKFKPQFSFSQEQPAKQQRLSLQDELKFGFTTAVKPKQRKNEFELESGLPIINYSSLNEKTIRKDRVNSLKNKFSKLLNLSEQQEREAVPSMCQYSSRRRNLSEIIRNHSHSKERLKQLDEVADLKQKLARVKVGVNFKALSKGLCLPENQEHQLNVSFPLKDLPSNPALIEPKKKKR